MTGDFGGAAGPHHVFHPLRQQGDGVFGHRPTLAGLAHPIHYLQSTEGLGDTAALDDREHRFLNRGEPFSALGAVPPAPDQRAIIGFARVDDPGIRMAAVWAPHVTPTLRL
ncbi:hypothetical protein Rhe02_66660 [Rhizocola hellebori]|uniref:Uncharacterized protein n=1 Tax=Rhizocola hellebori TaxID=1392758 RepID=A0A8J3QF62_9ACTN|nr:hypothetical protein Rhe02_66660 [Rhizocola hellebori]